MSLSVSVCVCVCVSVCVCVCVSRCARYFQFTLVVPWRKKKCKNVKNDVCRFWQLPSNGIIEKIVSVTLTLICLRHLDLDLSPSPWPWFVSVTLTLIFNFRCWLYVKLVCFRMSPEATIMKNKSAIHIQTLAIDRRKSCFSPQWPLPTFQGRKLHLILSKTLTASANISYDFKFLAYYSIIVAADHSQWIIIY